MAESKEAHVVVEIPIDEENRSLSAIEHHPLMEISQSPGHLLLLKLWQREEDLYGRRTARKETQMDSIKRDIFQLCSFFFLFHALFFTTLFTVDNEAQSCQKFWIPGLVSLSTSLLLVCLVQVKLFGYWEVLGRLQRERSENRALVRAIQELRMKGASFDLSKEPQLGKKMKSSSVEIKWRPIVWCSRYLITLCLLCFAGLVIPVCKFVLCGF